MIAVRLWCARTTPGGLTAGSTVGLWYAITGTGLMIFAGLPYAMRLVPTRPLVSRSTWLKGHIWLGLLSVVLIACHSGCRWGGFLERVLCVVFGLVMASGVGGLCLQQFLPRMITTRLTFEAPYEQIPHICEVMRHRADSLVDQLCGSPGVSTPAGAESSAARDVVDTQIRTFFESEVRPFLDANHRRSSTMFNPIRAASAFSRLRTLARSEPIQNALVELEALCDKRRQLAEQERLHHWLHAWLLMHVPLSLMLLFLGLLHVVTALYF